MESPYSLNNPVFCNLLFYATVLVLKMLAMSGLTAFYRIKKNVFANPEDVAIQKGVKPVFGDLDVERVRRCHLNDLENITPFLLLGLLYVSTMPNPAMALLHFRIFTIARFIHMVVYTMAVPQPARLLSFIVGLFVTISMAYQVLKVAVF